MPLIQSNNKDENELIKVAITERLQTDLPSHRSNPTSLFGGTQGLFDDKCH